MRALATSLAALLTAAFLPACADARGRFEEFEKRAAQISPDSGADAANAGAGGARDESYDGGPCVPPAPNSVSGPALLALDTSLGAGKPILFLGTIETPAKGGTTEVVFRYHPLDSADRKTRLGDELVVETDPLNGGVLFAHIDPTALDGNANPVLRGVSLTTEMNLHGHICGIHPFYCGTLDGKATGLLSADFTGHFGITLLPSADAVPDRPRYGCSPEDFAEKL